MTHQSIYVVDDDTQNRQFLHFVFSTFEITSWSFSSAIDFLDNLPYLEPAPILMDAHLPNIGGVKMMKMLLEQGVNWPIIVMTTHADIRTVVHTMKLGATDFLEKPFDLNLLNESVQLAFAKLPSLKHVEDIRCESRRLFETLTRRESEVIFARLDGMSNKAIAFHLSLSVRTIEMFRANAFLKLKVRNLAEVVRLAHDAGVNLASRGRLESVTPF